MGNEAAGIFLKNGLLGAAVVVLCLVIYALWKDAKEQAKAYAALQEQRVKDQEARIKAAEVYAEKLTVVNNQLVAGLTTVTSAMESYREGQAEVKTAFKDLSEDIRNGLRPGYRGPR